MEMLLELCERPPSAAGHMVRAPAPQGTVDRCTTEGRGQGMLGEDVGIEPDQGKALSRERPGAQLPRQAFLGALTGQRPFAQRNSCTHVSCSGLKLGLDSARLGTRHLSSGPAWAFSALR